MRPRTIREIQRTATPPGEPIVLGSGTTITLTAPAEGHMLVRCDVNANAPPEPRRDKQGRFRKRTGLWIVVGEGPADIRWTATMGTVPSVPFIATDEEAERLLGPEFRGVVSAVGRISPPVRVVDVTPMEKR